MEELKVVFIDWSGTLSTSKFWGHLEHTEHTFGDLFARIQSCMFAPSGPLANLMDPWQIGEFTSEQIVEKVSDELQIVDRDTLFQEFIKSCENMRFVSNEIPQLVEGIRDKGIKVVIATGNMDCFNRWTVPAMRLRDLFDDILNSYDLRAAKQDRDADGRSAFFGDFLEKHRLLPGESVLIDDSKRLGPVVQSFGITYRQIEPGIGLPAELKRILSQ